MKICSIEGCGSPELSRTWCNKHYRRWYVHGDTTHCNIAYTPEARLAKRSKQVNDCILWQGASNGMGYGVMTATGMGSSVTTKRVYVHRAAWILAYGPIPEGKDIDHTCHKRSCINVGHLQIVSRKENLENTKKLRVDNSSGYRGVSLHSGSGKWLVQVSHYGKTHRRYPFNTVEEANEAAIALRLLLHTNNLVDRGTNK